MPWRLAALATFAAACSAPAGEPSCEGFCANIIRCGGDTTERVCMWGCLAGLEYRRSKGRRCSRAVRNELACLAATDDCEFLLYDPVYDEGDPCVRKGHRRSNACQEDNIPADEVVPIEGLPRQDLGLSFVVDVVPESEASP